ncbi:MAG TPA: deoxyribodipyrimidine photo-lyase [Candidatus Kapabacteria bacterium]|nr:deoxyribodipyrimidine photo-lyase [Candidatus Kapabacteria bacterium]
MNIKRVRKLNNKPIADGEIIYWMSRDQRVEDNWAMVYANNLAKENGRKFKVIFTLDFSYPLANFRSFSFMLEGLKKVQDKLFELNISFELLIGNPIEKLIDYYKIHKVGAIVNDFDPLKIKKYWKQEIAKVIDCAFFEVDAHNIVPAFYVSDKQEFAAYTIRPKLHKLLKEFLEEYPKIDYYSLNGQIDKIDYFKDINDYLKNVDYVSPAQFKPGADEAYRLLNDFVENKLKYYSEKSNDPTYNFQSNLSPFLHFGQISAQRILLEIMSKDGVEAYSQEFIEELFVRRELSDNFCLFNSNYDNFDGFPDWAKDTLNKHRADKRDYDYSIEEFESAKTHDIFWNAAQNEMLYRGKMHGYMRMYWCKKILEWTNSPEEAQQIAIYLNDKYSIDGRDPNGYTGIAWSVGGVHDRPWNERPIFGKIRFMNDKGLIRKFNMQSYVEKWAYI